MTRPAIFLPWLARAAGHCNAAAYTSLFWCVRAVRVLFMLLLICYFLFCTLFLGLRYLVLPNVGLYKSELEHVASQAIGRSLSIEHIQTSWQGLNPHLLLEHVTIRDKDGQPALNLPSVKATVSWWSAVLMQLRFSSIEIDAPHLQALRNADGKIFIAGFPVQGAPGGEDAGLDWVMAQHEIVIRDGTLEWIDQQRHAPVLQLQNIQLLLKNRWRSHRFSLQAVPPSTLAAPLDVRGDFSHPAFSRHIADIANWRGDLYVDLQRANLPAIKAYIDYPADLQKAYGSVRSWTRLERSRIDDFTADIHISDVLGRFRKDLPQLDMAQISGRLSASEKPRSSSQNLFGLLGQGGHRIALSHFSMQARDGMQLPPTTIQESFIPADKDQAERVELYAESLDLQMLANFAEHLPLPADQRQMLADFNPKGQLKDFTARWQGSYPDLSSYSAKGQFIELSLSAQPARLAQERSGSKPAVAAVPAVPGFANLSGRLDVSDRGGSFILDSTNLALQLPGYFIDPVMPFKRLQMQASWLFEKDDKLNFQIHKMDMQQDGMTASLSGRHVISMRPDGDKGSIDLSGKVNGFDLRQLDRFIPENAPDQLRFWLTHGIQEGRADNVSIRIKGDLKDFPFAAKEGKNTRHSEFTVRGNINQGKLDFAPGMLAEDGKSALWPAIEEIKGSFLFEREKMEIRADSAKSLGLELSKVKAVIPDLLVPQLQLDIEGGISGAMQTMFQYVSASPVSIWTAHFFQESKASGNAKIALKLGLPLAHLFDSKVSGSVQLAGNDIVLDSVYPSLNGSNGKIDFNEHGFGLSNVKTNVLGGISVVSGGMQKDGAIHIHSEGNLSSDGLKREYAATPILPALAYVDGTTRYSLNINLKQGQAEIALDSNLQGLALNFPEPVYKAGNEILPLHFELNSLPSNANQISDEIRISAGKLLSARYQRQKSAEPNSDWKVVRGGVGVNNPAPFPETGVAANIEAAVLNADAWKNLLGSADNGNASAKQVQQFAPYMQMNRVMIHAAEMHVFGKKMDNVTLGLSLQDDHNWQANIDSSQVSGHLSWLAQPLPAGQLSGRLSRLIIPQAAANDVTELLEGKHVTSDMPGLDLSADEFELFGKKLGRLELQANNRVVAGGREWKIENLVLSNPDAELKASGNWNSQGEARGTTLKYALEIQDAGKLLERLGFAEVMRKGKGKLDGEVKWEGLPFALDTNTLSGKVQLDLHGGQFLKVEPGAAKLLGVLSLQSLARRLTLDFRDVFSDGFAFDAINSSAQIMHGVAQTSDFKMQSVNATVLIDGQADIGKESQNLHVIVLPEINTGGASVLYGLAVNPVVGLGTLLAQLFLRDPLTRAFTYEYQVTGPWKEPTVVKLDLSALKAANPNLQTMK